MEISGVSITTSQATNVTGNTPDAISDQLLKKALDIQQQSADQLIKSIPDPDSKLGRNVDVEV